MSFWLKPRQIVLLDAHGGKPARNFYVRAITLVIALLLLTGIPFVLGAWYAPFHNMREVIPENLKLKRQNQTLRQNLAEANTLAHLKDEQIEGLKEQIARQEQDIQQLTGELHMFKSILEERKGKGIQVMQHQAHWLGEQQIAWKALFVKGGTYPRYLAGTYQVTALDEQGHRKDLFQTPQKYRFETHRILDTRFEWQEAWKPTKLELAIYNYRKKEVLKQAIPIQGI